jgi:hypothetical protein
MNTSILDSRPGVINDVTRRRFILGGASLAALLAACGGQSEPTSPTTGDAAEGAGFQVTVAHKYGSTTMEPQNGLFRDLGFIQPALIAELLVDEDGYSGSLSDERMELLDGNPATTVVQR